MLSRTRLRTWIPEGSPTEVVSILLQFPSQVLVAGSYHHLPQLLASCDLVIRSSRKEEVSLEGAITYP